MSKNCEDLLISEPRNELVFRKFSEDGGGYGMTAVVLKNPKKTGAYFKVMTTEPSGFCVRPKMGYVPPGSAITVSVRPRRTWLPSSKVPRFKIFTVEGEAGHDVETVWSQPERIEWGGVKAIRLTCSFAEEHPVSQGILKHTASARLVAKTLTIVTLILAVVFMAGQYLGQEFSFLS